MFWERPEVSLLGTMRVLCSNSEWRFGGASFRRLRLVLLIFTSCVWDVWDIEYSEKQLLIFSETWSPSFCVQLFWWFSHKPSEKDWAISPKQNTKFPKRRWVRPKIVLLSAALLFSLVVTKKIVLRTSWDLST